MACRELRDIEIWHELADVDNVDDALLGKLVTLERTHSNRNFVDALYALGRRDHDFFDEIVFDRHTNPLTLTFFIVNSPWERLRSC